MAWTDSIKSFLIHAQSVTKTDNVYLVKNLWYVGSSQIIAIVSGLCIYLLVARFVPQNVFGEYRYFVSLFELAAITSLTGMKIALLRSVSRGFTGSLRATFRYRLRSGYLLGLPFVAAAIWYFVRGASPLALAMVLIYVVAPWVYACSSYHVYLQGREDFKRIRAYTLIQELFLFVAMVGAVFFAKDAVSFFGYFLLANFVHLVLYSIVVKTVLLSEEDPGLFEHGKHQSKLDFLLTIASRLDGILVFQTIGAASLASYSFAILTADQMKLLVSAIYTIAGPKLAKNSLADTLVVFPRKMFFMGLLGVGMTILYYVVAPFVYQWLFPAYVSVVGYSRLYAVSLIFTLPAQLAIYLLNVQGLQAEAERSMIVSNGILIVLLMIGGVGYGIWGIITARLIASAVQLGIVTHVLFWRKLESKKNLGR